MIPLSNLRPFTGDVVVPSPNHGVRRADAIHGIVLHATADAGDEAAAVTRMRSPGTRASCHLVVARDGKVTRLVGDRQRAWHAGGARWRGTRDVNSITLGIAIANRNDGEPFTDAQYRRVAEIAAHYCSQGLAGDDVVGLGDIAVSGRSDPVGWNWTRLRGMVAYQLTAAKLPPRPSAAAPAAPAAAPRVATPAVAPVQRTRGTGRADRKPAARSRTLWLNGVTVLAAGSMIVAETLDLAFSVGLTLPEELTMWALFAVGLVNILLRFLTRTPIGREPGAEPVSPRTMVPVRARSHRVPPGALAER